MAGTDRWAEVDRYIEPVVRPDAALEEALASTSRAGMPAIAVSAAQGKFLHVLARSIGARTIVEIGTLGGYSTIWLARALPAGGRLVSLELDARHAEVARANLGRAGVGDEVEIRVGPALDSLPGLAGQVGGQVDLTFVDADKANIPAYFDWAVHLGRPGGTVVVDNVVRDGKLVDAGSDDPNVIGVRRFHEMLAGRDDVSATTIQTVGAKGYDGFTIAVIG